MKLTPQLRARLNAAHRDLATRAAICVAGWSDDQCLSALGLITAGHSVRDAVAIVMGDAVVEDGVVDYNPGCAWIDSVLDRRPPSQAECARILDQWESQRDTIGADFAATSIASPRTARSLHLVF